MIEDLVEHVPAVLHGYFRSSAAYRVRIALNLKGVPFRNVSHHLRKQEQREPGYLKLNPQGLVPALEIDGAVLTQSLAICQYLDDTRPPPLLLAAEPQLKAKILAFAQVIACDVHPLQNLKILQRLRELGLEESQVTAWAARTIDEGLSACALLLPPGDLPFCFGEGPSLADICLVPQLGNARRFGVDLCWPRLTAIEANCLALPAFRDAAPENQPDAD
jgi:maleylpyruvate isomerase